MTKGESDLTAQTAVHAPGEALGPWLPGKKSKALEVKPTQAAASSSSKQPVPQQHFIVHTIPQFKVQTMAQSWSVGLSLGAGPGGANVGVNAGAARGAPFVSIGFMSSKVYEAGTVIKIPKEADGLWVSIQRCNVLTNSAGTKYVPVDEWRVVHEWYDGDDDNGISISDGPTFSLVSDGDPATMTVKAAMDLLLGAGVVALRPTLLAQPPQGGGGPGGAGGPAGA